MKVMLDTSVLAAAMVASHPDHAHAFAWFRRARQGEVEIVVAVPTLPDLYEALMDMPVRPRISPDMARRMMRENIESCARLQHLTTEDYAALLNELATLGLHGDAIAIAITAWTAAKAGVDRLLTLHPDVFKRCTPCRIECIEKP